VTADNIETPLPTGGLSRRALLQAAGALGVGTLLTACGGSSPTGTSSTRTSAAPRRGGVLQAGLSGGTSSDTLDPQATVNNIDFARAFSLFNSLVEFDLDAQPRLSLAQELTADKSATSWTIRLRSGVTWHDGRDLSADDVLFSLRRITDPKNPLEGASQLASLDLANAKKLDSLTVRIPCHAPFSSLPETLASYFFFLVPQGFDPKKPIGTGPFKFESFTPGVQSKFSRFPDYWETGLPHLDGLVITDYTDETSQVNALDGGQVDVIDLLSAASVATVRGGGARVQIAKGGGFNPFTMRTDATPFRDNRVRQALRLIVDRPEMLRQVFAGYGAIGNDVFSPYDPAFDRSLPQRSQDIEKAKSLLRAAGSQGLKLQLVTSSIAQGVVTSAQVFAQQAQTAGVDVSLRQVTPTDFYGSNYLKWVFAQDYWVYTPYLVQVGQATLPSSPFNESHFDNPSYDTLYKQALATVDGTRRTELIHEMQQIDYNEGAYIIPYFAPVIDGYSTKIGGVTTSKTGLALGNFGFKRMWLE
jgi:peptide/nickel transport system substrate-binding protein